jgi:hypothetical protein
MSIRVLDPTVDTVPLKPGATTRFTSLKGLTVGLLDNGKVNVRPLLDAMEDILRTQHGVKTVRRFKKPDASRPAPPAVLESMAGCDAMIAAVGD